MSIPIFKAERDAGLSEVIQAKASLGYASLVESAIGFCELSESKARVSEYVLAKAGGGEAAHINLHPFKSLLVSIGWNKNDDVFDPYEVWAARTTPEDQPINIEHDSTKIRGHITGQYPVNAKLERLADDLAVDELPEKFHIITAGVLYKKYENEDVQKEMVEVISELAEGKWYVSMECLLRGFDYAVIDSKGSHHVVPRCDESAFLTKHLRAYGGDGKYQGYKVGRLLRNISFSGKGLVKKPANPESVILAEATTFSGVSQKFSQVFSSSGYESSTEEIKVETVIAMPTEIELLKEQLKNATDEKLAAQAALKEVETQKLTDMAAQLKAKADELETLKSKASDMGAELSKVTAKLNEVENELATTKATAKKTERKAALMTSLEYSDEKATKLAESWASMSDEAFTVAVDAMKEKLDEYKKAANQPNVKETSRVENENDHGAGHPKAPGLQTTPAKQPEKKSVKTIEINGVPRKEAGDQASTIETATSTEVKAAETNPAETKADADVTLTTATDQPNEKIESTRAAIAGYLKDGHFLNRRRRNQPQTKE